MREGGGWALIFFIIISAEENQVCELLKKILFVYCFVFIGITELCQKLKLLIKHRTGQDQQIRILQNTQAYLYKYKPQAYLPKKNQTHGGTMHK